MKKWFVLLLPLLLGCGIDPVKNPDYIEISGRVTLHGKPLGDAFLHLQPTGSGVQGMLAVKNGEFRGPAMPGKYTYYLEGSKPAIAKLIPEKFRAGSLDRQIEITSGTILDVTLE